MKLIYAKIVGYGMTWFILFALVMNALFEVPAENGLAKVLAAATLLIPIGVYGYLTGVKLKELWAKFQELQRK